MKRRWLGVVLMLWTLLVPVFSVLVSAPAAQAATVYTVTSATTIQSDGSDCSGKKLTYTDGPGKAGSPSQSWPAGTYAYAHPAGRAGGATLFTITGITAADSNNPPKTFTATVQSGGGFIGCAPSGQITINNPNGIALKDASSSGGGNGNGTGNNTDPTTLCDAGVLTWLNCALMSGAINLIDGIRDAIIAPFLKVQPLTTTLKGGGANPVYQIWQNFRNVAAVMMILVFFAIIFGTALGFDNYTIKKSLPHLVAGAILMPLSFYICAVMVDIGNILGQGILTLADSFLPKPYVDFTQPLSLIFYGVGATVAAIALKGAVADIGLALLITIVIAVLATFFTLVLRQIIIYLLVVLSPFAILAWILPNTSKWFTQWWQNFFKLILMYPLIMLLFEAGRIFATVAPTAFTGGGGASDIMKAAVPILAIVGLYLPLGAVPWTFSWAGGAMKMGAGAVGRIGGSANKRWGKGSKFDDARKQRKQEKAASSYLGAPTTRLGRALQFKTDKNGNVVERKTAGFARAMAATRGGFGGAFPGQGPSIVQKRAMAGMAQKALHDEEVARAAQDVLAEQLRNGSYRSYNERVSEGVQATLHAEAKKAREAVLAEGQRKGMSSEDWQQVIEGKTDFGAKGHYSGSIAREAAIQHTSGQDYSWDRTRAALKAGTISSTEVRNGLQSVPGAASKARDVALGADAGFTQADWNNDAQMDFFSGRGPSHRLGFDKETRWQDMDRAKMLQARLAAGQTTYVDSKGKTVSTAAILDQHRADLADSYAKISQVAQDWSKLDNVTAKRIAKNAHDAATNAADLGFTPAQIAELQAHITADGKAI